MMAAGVLLHPRKINGHAEISPRGTATTVLEMGGDRQTSRWFQSNQNPFKCEKRQNTHKQPCTGRAAERLSDCLPKL